MRVAVLSLVRDRLAYTKHCFQTLHDLAGCGFDHVVLDQASQDGTREWLQDEYDAGRIDGLFLEPHNVGISCGINKLLDATLPPLYDVVVKFDPDCELVTADTLSIVAELCVAGNALLSPRILGLNNPPGATGEFAIGWETILDVPQIGGIFLAAPASLYDGFRFNEANPVWGADDSEICAWHRAQGGRCGYVKRLEAWHYESTAGQHARFPQYFARTLAEGKPAL